ncbi:MAG: hypothetical protein ACHQ1D_00155 [Nitrososphaerales archaeon]
MAKSWLQKYGTYEEVVVGADTGITAFAGGDQINATQLTKKFNQVDNCANDYDSVKLDSALTGKLQTVFNNTIKLLSVYPVSGQVINGVVDYEFVIGPGDAIDFKSISSGKIKASGTSL